MCCDQNRQVDKTKGDVFFKEMQPGRYLKCVYREESKIKKKNKKSKNIIKINFSLPLVNWWARAEPKFFKGVRSEGLQCPHRTGV